MKYAVWTLGSSRKGPFYPRVVEADSFEHAVEQYNEARRVDTPSSGIGTPYVVAQVGEVVEVTRKRKYEYETIIRPYDPDRK